MAVFVKGYMRGSAHIRGYTRRQTAKARFILNKLNKKGAKFLQKGQTDKAIRLANRGRKIINKYF